MFSPRKLTLICLVSIMLVLCCRCTANLEAPYDPPKLEEDGSTFWYSLPAGMYYEGRHKRAYFAYYTSDYYVRLRYFDEERKTLSAPVTLWSDWGYSNDDVLGDHHAAPTAIVLQHQTRDNATHNGKILVAASEHASGTPGKGRLETRRSTYLEFNDNGRENTSFDTAVQIRSAHATYSNLVELNDGTIFLFSRLSYEGDDSRATTYAWVSADAGASWTPYNGGHALWDAPTGTDDSYYLQACPNNDGTGIHCMISRVDYDNPSAGIQRYLNIYYLFYNHSDDKWYRADGTTEFALGSSHTSMDLVYDTDDTPSAEDWTWAWDIKDDGGGNPYLVFVNDVDRGSGSGGNCDVLRANYGGGSWNIETVLTEGTGHSSNYPHGACLDPLDVDVVYVTPPLGNPGLPTTSRTQLQRYRKNEGNWSKVEDITQTSPGSQMWPTPIRNAGGNNLLRILYMYSERYTGFKDGQWQSSLFGYPLG